MFNKRTWTVGRMELYFDPKSILRIIPIVVLSLILGVVGRGNIIPVLLLGFVIGVVANMFRMKFSKPWVTSAGLALGAVLLVLVSAIRLSIDGSAEQFPLLILGSLVGLIANSARFD